MATYSADQLAGLVKRTAQEQTAGHQLPRTGGGFPTPDFNALTTAVAIALAESSGRTDVTSPNPNGGVNVGLWQLDTQGAGQGHSEASLKDPQTNATVTWQVTRGFRDWGQWQTFTQGTYKESRYWGPASKAVGKNGGVEGVFDSAKSGVLGWTQAVGDFFGALTQANTWIRVGEVIIGVILIAAGVAKLTGAGGTVAKVAKVGELAAL